MSHQRLGGALMTDLRQSIRNVLFATSALSLSPVPLANAQDNAALEEIVVTATRREQAVEDIPVNIAVVTGATLRNAGVSSVQDLTEMVPGLSNEDIGPRGNSVSNTLVIRGLNAVSSGNGSGSPNVTVPLVTTYVDDTPMFFNMKLTDIERVEVMRGPQGTLYGSGAVGGTVRIIHAKPTTDAFYADFSSRGFATDHSDDLSYSVEGVANLPLSDSLALRATGGYESISGFTDALRLVAYDPDNQPILADPTDPLNSGLTFRRQDDVDDSDTKHLRVALSWDISDAVNALLSYAYQEDSAGSYTQQSPGLDYQQTQFTLSPLERDVDIAALDVTADLGFASFTSATSYYDNVSNGRRDLTGLMININNGSPFAYGFFPRVQSTITDFARDRSFVQEFRLVSESDTNWDWVVGAFYRDQDWVSNLNPQVMPGLAEWSELDGSADALNDIFGPGTFANFGDFVEFYNGGPRPSSLDLTDFIYSLDRQIKFQDIAVFGELTYQFTESWQVTAGARAFWQDFQQSMVQQLPICGPFCSDNGTDPFGTVNSTVDRDFQDQIFKFNTSYDFGDKTMVYFTWAEGFRRGGGNALAVGPCFLCESDDSLLDYEPDTATNVEVGVKGRRFDDRVGYTVSAYRIDWDNIQIDSTTSPGGFFFVLNGSSAVSKGLETEINAQLSENLLINFGYVRAETELTESFVVENVVGREGDTLPLVPKHQASVGVSYFVPLQADRELHFRLDASYRSEINSTLSPYRFDDTLQDFVFDPAERNFAKLGSATKLNASVDLSLGNWRVGVFARNITGEKGINAVNTNNDETALNSVTVVRPRMVGLRLGYEWQ